MKFLYLDIKAFIKSNGITILVKGVVALTSLPFLVVNTRTLSKLVSFVVSNGNGYSSNTGLSTSISSDGKIFLLPV